MKDFFEMLGIDDTDENDYNQILWEFGSKI